MLGSLVLAVASGFLGGIVVLAAGLGMGRARQQGALRVAGLVTLLALLVVALVSGVAFLWLAATLRSPTVSAFAFGAGLGAAVGVAVALVVGLTLVSVLLLRPPRRATGATGAYGYAPVGRRMAQW